MLLIWLTENDDGSASLRLEEAFHGCRGRRLVAGHVLTVQIATGKHLPQGRGDSGYNSHPEKDARVLHEFLLQQVECAHACHYECSRNHGAAHIVGVLKERPRIGQESPKARNTEAPVGQTGVSHWMLHPCVSHDDEESRQP